MALLAVALQACLRGLEGNLARFTGRETASFNYSALHHAGRSGAALRNWNTALADLREVGLAVVSPNDIIRAHVLVDLALVIVYVVLAALVIRRLGLPPWVLALVGGAAATDVVRAAIEFWTSYSGSLPGWTNPFMSLLPDVKLALLAIVVAIAVVAKRRGLRSAFRYTVGSPASERIMLAASVGFVLLLFLGQVGVQFEEVMRTWASPGGVVPAVEALLAMGLLLVAVRFLGRAEPKSAEPDARVMLALGIAAVVVGVGVLAWSHGSGLLVGGVILVAVGVTSKLLAPRPRAEAAYPTGEYLRPVIVALPALAVYLLTVRVVVAELVTRGHRAQALVVTLVWLATTFAVGVIAARPSRRAPAARPERPMTAVLLISVALVGGLMLLATTGSGLPLRRVGSVTILLLALCALGAAGAILRATEHEAGCPESLLRLGFRRTPLVFLIVVWTLTAALIDGRNDSFEFNDVRTIGATEPASTTASPACSQPPPSLAVRPDGPVGEVALRLCAWLERTAAGKTDEVVPLVLVTASGGGVRAAAWTARVLDCLFLPGPSAKKDPCPSTRPASLDERWPYVFAAGGASGGSVGLVSTVAEALTMPPTGGHRKDWLPERMGGDMLAPAAGFTLLKELPMGLAGLYVGKDRTATLEKTWGWDWRNRHVHACAALAGRPVTEVGFLAASSQCAGTVPLLLLNGTNTSDGQRVNISPLAGAPLGGGGYLLPSHDLRESLCPATDLRLFTAAFLSARFPVISSTARVPEHACKTDAGTRPILHVVDGGYRDNSGTSQVGELLQVLAPMIAAHNASPGGFARVRPVLIHVDNGAAFPFSIAGPTSDLADILRPIEAALRIGLDRGAEDLQRLQGAVRRLPSDPAPPIEVTFRLLDHPGRTLPLGWTLSDAAFKDICNVFRLNDQSAKTVRAAMPVGPPSLSVSPSLPKDTCGSMAPAPR